MMQLARLDTGMEVRDAAHGRLIAAFNFTELDRFIAEGQLSVAELLPTDAPSQARLCQRLALLACAKQCARAEQCSHCPHRMSGYASVPPGLHYAS